MQRAQLGVLAQRVDAGLNTAQGIVDRLTGFAFDQLGEFLGHRFHRRGGSSDPGGPFSRGGAHPAAASVAGAGNRAPALLGVGDRDPGHGVAAARIKNGQFQRVGHV